MHRKFHVKILNGVATVRSQNTQFNWCKGSQWPSLLGFCAGTTFFFLRFFGFLLFLLGRKNFRYTYIGKEIKTHVKSVHTKDPTQRLLQLRGPEN
eukprot:sb/3479300/